MGFLQRFLKNNYRDSQQAEGKSSFRSLSEEELETHLGISSYGNFKLTDAIRPSYNLDVIPSAGYRHDYYDDKQTGIRIPVLMAAGSREYLFDLFIDLLDPLGDSVDVVIETSHDENNGSHNDLYREQIDLPVLKSTLYDFEEQFINDGCLGLAVLNPRIPLEVQFDEHKLLIMYGQELKPFEQILGDYNLSENGDMKFITEAEHVHSSSDEFMGSIDQMKFRLGIDD
ncbi:hypothetical protein MNBD_PLANCTO02-208 [hydrothermal vent metagenome]|uniref:Uncharacterized protein n=1 Tax=hydrothermal vent metagenome TaxID=652676 RepID=A0A3B1DCD8_9ZZZZ